MKKMMELARNEHIIVQSADFPYPLRGIYIDDGKLKMIGIAKDIETLAERRSVLAEELGHHLADYFTVTEKFMAFCVKMYKGD